MDTSAAATELAQDQEEKIKDEEASSSSQSNTKGTEPARKKLSWSKLHTFSCARPFSITDEQDGSIKSVGTEGFSRLVLIGKFPSPSDGESDSEQKTVTVKPQRRDGRRANNAVVYPSNWVSTTKYNLVTFIPKALFEQFRRVANLYFLFTAALSVTPLSPFSAASLIAPLVFVVGVSMAKEALEDWHRFLQVIIYIYSSIYILGSIISSFIHF